MATIANYDISQVFLRGMVTVARSFDNSAGGADVTITNGTVLGIVSATNKVKTCVSSATDGSQLPRFICAGTVTIAAGAIGDVMCCKDGWVNEDKTIFSNGTDTWATTVSTTDSGTQTTVQGTMRDVLQANSNITLLSGVDGSYYDNQP